VPAREVDDAEAAHPQTNMSLEVDAFIVRAAVSDRSEHPGQHCSIDGPLWVPVDDPDDAAHI
jgi:hypothetical protein